MVKISRLLILKCFKGNGSNFIIDARRNGKPVKGTKNRSNGVETTGRWNDYTSKRVLDKLEAMDGLKRETKEKRIAVVKFSVSLPFALLLSITFANFVRSALFSIALP